MQFTKYQISLHSGANARAERMTLFDWAKKQFNRYQKFNVLKKKKKN